MPLTKIPASLRRALAAMLVVLLTLVVFSPVRHFQFVQLDDPKHIVENPHLNPPALAKLPEVWKEPYFGMYIPMTYTVWGLTTIFTNIGSQPPAFHPNTYHTLNWIFHAVNALLVFFLLLRLLHAKDSAPPALPEFAALCGALLFSLHPVQVESVAWISSLKDLLSTTFSLGCFWWFLNFLDDEDRFSKKAYAASLLCFCLALLSKPSAVVLPFFAAGIAIAYRGISIKRLALLLLPWLALAIPVAVLTKSAQPSANIIHLSPLWMRPLLALDALAFYVYKILFPFELSMDYGRTPKWVMGTVWIYISWFLPAGLAWILHRTRDEPRLKGVRWGLGLAVIALLPVLGLVPFLFQIFSTVADRYLYLPLFALATALSALLRHTPNWVRGVTVAGLAALALLTSRHLPRWENGMGIFAHSVGVNPRSVLAHNNLGVEFQVRGKFKEAAASFRKALELDPKRFDLYSNLGAALVASGDILEGIEQLRFAEKNGASPAITHYNLGRAYLRLGRYQQARRYARLALAQDPHTPRVKDLYRATH